MKTKPFLFFLVFLSIFPLTQARALTDADKLQNTAKGLRELAQTKKNMAQNMKKESIRKQLLDGAAQDEKLAAETEGKAKEEASLQKDSTVKAARAAEKKALDNFNKTNDELEKTKTVIQKAQGTSKERADNGDKFLKMMSEANEKKIAWQDAARKREVAEEKVRKNLKGKT